MARSLPGLETAPRPLHRARERGSGLPWTGRPSMAISAHAPTVGLVHIAAVSSLALTNVLLRAPSGEHTCPCLWCRHPRVELLHQDKWIFSSGQHCRAASQGIRSTGHSLSEFQIHHTPKGFQPAAAAETHRSAVYMRMHTGTCTHMHTFPEFTHMICGRRLCTHTCTCAHTGTHVYTHIS